MNLSYFNEDSYRRGQEGGVGLSGAGGCLLRSGRHAISSNRALEDIRTFTMTPQADAPPGLTAESPPGPAGRRAGRAYGAGD